LPPLGGGRGALTSLSTQASQLFVANGGGNSVFDYSTSPVGGPGTFVAPGSGGLESPRGLAFRPDGLYVAGLNGIYVYNTAGAFIREFGAGTNPFGLVFNGGYLYATDVFGNFVDEYNPTTGALVSTFVPAGSGGLSGARGLVFAPDGNLLVSSPGSGNILEYNGTTGAFIGVFASGLDPRDLVFGPNGNLYVANFAGNDVLELNGSTGALIGTLASTGLNGPVGVLFGPDGELYVDGFNNNVVNEYDGINGAYIQTIGSGAGLVNPRGSAFAVPEPNTLALLNLGLIGALAASRLSRKRTLRKVH
jgi:DNA-binding beta-propeller fold protein YncE